MDPGNDFVPSYITVNTDNSNEFVSESKVRKNFVLALSKDRVELEVS